MRDFSPTVSKALNNLHCLYNCNEITYEEYIIKRDVIIS